MGKTTLKMCVRLLRNITTEQSQSKTKLSKGNAMNVESTNNGTWIVVLPPLDKRLDRICFTAPVRSLRSGSTVATAALTSRTTDKQDKKPMLQEIWIECQNSKSMVIKIMASALHKDSTIE